MRLLILALTAATLLAAESFDAVHVRDGWFNGDGTLHITAEGIRYEAAKPKHSRQWPWLDIQHVDRLTESEIDILTYEDQTKYLGRDKSYRFRLTGGALADEFMARIEKWFGRPVTDRVARDAGAAAYELPVKHLHSLGGCEGELRFVNGAVFYATEHTKDARRWRLDRDVDSVWSAHPYHFEIHVYEKNRREFSHTRIYQFDLKEKLDPKFYRELKLRLYQLQTD